MRRLAILLALTAVALGCGEPPAGAPARRLLYLTHTAAFRHDVLELSHRIVGEVGRSSGGFETTVTEDCASITADSLAAYDAVFFFTTGELPLDDGQKQALLDYVRGGKGFVGAHSATDTFYEWPAYGEMLGGYFDGHPWHDTVMIKVEDGTHPATRHLPPMFSLRDEIYQFRSWSRDRVRVLLSLDTASVDLGAPNVRRDDGDFALAWTREYGRGRVFYTALGHGPDVWRDERFQSHLAGGIRWAMGDD